MDKTYINAWRNPADSRYREFQRQRHLKNKVLDFSQPITEIAEEVIDWMEEPKCSYEPYALFLRSCLKVKHNDPNVNVLKWSDIFPRIEKLCEIVERKGSVFAKMILNETIAHRYVDYWLHTQNSAYEQKMKDAYLSACRYAQQGNYYKNIDSSIYWLAVAYDRAGRPEEAKKYFCQVARRSGTRFVQSLHYRKIEHAKTRCGDTR